MADVEKNSISPTEFGKLFFEFKPRFITFAYRYVRDREIAEDLVSDSFMTFWEMHENLPRDVNIPAYILTSVRNGCLNYLNAQMRHRRAEQEIHSSLTRRLHADVRSLTACDPNLLFSEEIRAIMKQAVRKMPKMTRNVFLLSRLHDMTYNQIASELGITSSHVNFEIRRALALLRNELKDYLPAALISILLSGRWY
ncbi:RNA polymerase sigma-70 factor [Alistipes sp.]|uniref:RNA polymerase sigma-70 factor n=1 Tax=Alistipes sp. TaxID=1872444 RepID=UPI003AF0387A